MVAPFSIVFHYQVVEAWGAAFVEMVQRGKVRDDKGPVRYYNALKAARVEGFAVGGILRCRRQTPLSHNVILGKKYFEVV